jgi:hypothetical protein
MRLGAYAADVIAVSVGADKAGCRARCRDYVTFYWSSSQQWQESIWPLLTACLDDAAPHYRGHGARSRRGCGLESGVGTGYRPSDAAYEIEASAKRAPWRGGGHLVRVGPHLWRTCRPGTCGQRPRRTGQLALLCAAVLWPVSLMPALVGLGGLTYSLFGTLLGLVFIWLSILFARERSALTARRLCLFSIVYLSLLWGVLVADRLWLSQ